jgi:hypothetical protein
MGVPGRTRSARTAGRRQRWYLLIHQLPPEPLYLRAKIRQRLARVGAVPLKNAVYALPRREECLEDFQWIAQEASAGGGEAHVCEAEFPETRTDAALVERFRAERNADYRRLAREIGGASATRADPEKLARARKRFEEIRRIDFFDAPGGREAAARLTGLERRPRAPRPARGGTMERKDLVGRTWTTRRGVKIDRIASAWLVRRFIDARARFRFVDPAEPPRPRELGFDMVGGEFTHEGDRCTFETLLARAGLSDPALAKVAEIVHDIDVKDGKFARPEAAGIAQVLTGLFQSYPEDKARLTRGFALFDELYESFRGKPRRRGRPKA